MLRISRPSLSTSSSYYFLCETIAIFTSVHVGLALRFWGNDPFELLKYQDFLIKSLLFVVVYQGSLYYNDLYMGRLFNTWELCARVSVSSAAAVVLLAIGYFVYPGVLIGRGVFAISIVLSFAIILSGRLLLSRFTMNGKFSQRILILGSGNRAKEVAELIRGQEHLGYKLVGFIGHCDTSMDPENRESEKSRQVGVAAENFETETRMDRSVTEVPIRFVAADYYFDRIELPKEVIPTGKSHSYS